MAARSRRRRAQVRLPRRAVPVPALDGALRAEGPAPRRAADGGAERADYEDATGHARRRPRARRAGDGGAPPKLRVEHRRRVCAPGSAYDLSDGALLGRGDQADIRLEDAFASSRHARLVPHGDVMVLEDLGSTNGTYLNGEPLRGPQPLHVGDRIRIGDSEFTFER